MTSKAVMSFANRAPVSCDSHPRSNTWALVGTFVAGALSYRQTPTDRARAVIVVLG